MAESEKEETLEVVVAVTDMKWGDFGLGWANLVVGGTALAARGNIDRSLAVVRLFTWTKFLWFLALLCFAYGHTY